MASHPYISGPGNITSMVAYLRKNFPATVTSDTVKKLGLASNNESYVINALQFLGIINEEGKRTDKGQETFAIHDDEAFKRSFGELIKAAYKDLFDLRADEAWTMSKSELIGYFRSADKTSEVIGTRQAAVFQALRGIAGYENGAGEKAAGTNKSAAKSTKQKNTKTEKVKASTKVAALATDPAVHFKPAKKDMALTVRVEINLPAEASAETYDNIFKSIKANLLNE
ncbi:DUF5343 domain-containing protein [Bradyrhizobium japonicum]|uniref:DUF5343 domain-containing protein n=1 Tax=Bradyrhizobium japonicum TaxID=375 RepID=UPI001BAA014C|nr:DUF5343 domain-containing protein [Bradyrhizobium japonicum]MBR0994160.1 DUF5343 domain-containing protein [Bradyrhizobium japonicum]